MGMSCCKAAAFGGRNLSVLCAAGRYWKNRAGEHRAIEIDDKRLEEVSLYEIACRIESNP